MPEGQNAAMLLVPLWAAVTAGAGVLATLIAGVAWVFSTFETKADANERHTALADRVTNQEQVLASVARDVSYIRGRMEPK